MLTLSPPMSRCSGLQDRLDEQRRLVQVARRAPLGVDIAVDALQLIRRKSDAARDVGGRDVVIAPVKAEVHQVPFTIFVPTSFAEQTGELWWLALEEVIARHDEVTLDIDGRPWRVACATTDD